MTEADVAAFLQVEPEEFHAVALAAQPVEVDFADLGVVALPSGHPGNLLLAQGLKDRGGKTFRRGEERPTEFATHPLTETGDV